MVRVEERPLEPAPNPSVSTRRDDGKGYVVDETDALLALLLERGREEEGVDGPGEVERRRQQDARVEHVEEVVLCLLEWMMEIVELGIGAEVSVACNEEEWSSAKWDGRDLTDEA